MTSANVTAARAVSALVPSVQNPLESGGETWKNFQSEIKFNLMKLYHRITGHKKISCIIEFNLEKVIE